MKKTILVLGISSMIISCQNSQQMPLITTTQEYNCDSCHLDEFVVVQNLTDTIAIDTINETVAIEFFNLLATIHKYDPEFPDSLPEKCQDDERQMIYRTNDQFGMYGARVYPKLVELGVNILKPSVDEKKMSFWVDEAIYNIDITYFVENDGVIFFTPGKLPILWSLESGSKHCSEAQFVNCYYE